MIAVALQVEDQ